MSTAPDPRRTATGLATPDPTPSGPGAPSTGKPRVHRRLRWPLRAYRVLIGFLVAAVLGNIAIVPLAQGTDDWLASARGQIAALLTLVQQHPLTTLDIAALLIGLYIFAKWAEREEQREERAASDARVADVAGAAASARIEEHIPAVIAASAEEAARRAVEAAQRITAAVPTQPLGLVAPNGLPRAANLIGREAELEKLLAALRTGSSPVGVFAVEGLGGVGKTALAAEAVVRLALDSTAFPGGAIWLSCEGLGGPDGLATLWSNIARALGADQVAALPDPEQRRAALRATLSDPARPRLLLALDNVEPDLDADALLDTLAGGRAVLLLTARHAIAPRRLTALALPPLADPAAIALFTARLRQMDPARPTPDDAPAIARLVTLVGGLPLAIELAAAYAGVQRIPLPDLAAEVEREGLAAGALYDAKHGVSLRFDRSWRVLTESQRRLFAGLSVLEGATFPRAAALALIPAARAGLPDTTPAAPETAELDALVALALVEPQPHSRLRLHPLLREYAAARLAALDPATSDRLGDAALAYWLAYAQEYMYIPGKDIANLDVLEAEAAGLMGALTWAHDHARHRDLLALEKAMRWYWHTRGRIDQARIARPWMVEAAEALGDKRELRSSLHELAVLDGRTGRLAEARAGHERALALARELGDPAAEQAELHGLAVLDLQTGRVAEARAGHERALALARQLGDPAAEQVELHSLAVLDAQTGRLAEARAGYERALALARELGDPSATATELRDLGSFIGQHGEPKRSRELLSEAVTIFTQLGAVLELGWCYQRLAWLDRDAGDRESAIAHFREALRLFEQVQSPDAEQVRAALRRLGAE